MNWKEIWMTLFGTTEWLGLNIGFWVSMAVVVLIVIVMNIVFWSMKPKNGKTDKPIASRRHYTRIHIETQTAARWQKKKTRAAERFSLTRGVAVRFRAAASLYLIVQSNSLQKTPLTNPVSVSEF